jgi:metal-responsive CopG/Arc/MetJ family transcriptional regulator
MKRAAKSSSIVRRSVALPRTLVDEVTSIAPAPLRANFNRLVSTALRDFAEAQRSQALERAMQEMAADPEIQAECRAIARDFAHTELDGLPDD